MLQHYEKYWGPPRSLAGWLFLQIVLSFGSYVFVLPTYSGNFKFLLRSLMGLKTSYSLIIELKLFGIKEDVLDLRGFFFDGNAR